MSQERISVDDLLQKQAAPPKLLVTIEALTEPDLVKVTPFNSGARCACNTALKIRKEAIDWVKPTDQTHECCGKQLIVVEIGLKDATLADVLGQLAANAQTRSLPTPEQAQAYFQDNMPPAGAARPRRPTARRPPGRNERPLGPVGIWDPEEGSSGVGEQNTCEDMFANCNYWCKIFGRSYPSGASRCHCNCQVDYWRCLDPNTFIPVDCNQL
ncbi:hypothetical protein GTP58_04900 [Duganella sp. CY15W]|uniref:hypothetical protein n=1 Tax=Duganella sp. CY15W TaxID=2692172 RepID=UPI001371E794|nr:hypothetical protein [Duganella sp. CY15W]MYM27651.1 hypothetical protein [Duganella sp. CY15W]